MRLVTFSSCSVLQNTLNLGNRIQQPQQQTTAQDVAAQIYNAQLQQQQQQQVVRDNTSALSQVIPQARTTYGGVVNPFLMANTDPYAIDRAARLHRNAAGESRSLTHWYTENLKVSEIHLMILN